eukprot:CAMPEP_0196586206 /NCGR_PEP_ID=MMETSP1081-20130531/53484_1 /TAXON_ID=36882 /ORGANISM="Pyramimonas amylifera, Strain CCMP720" /LENGTH=516 /DNA_ID=CAMNT_0041908005 /DNA_START=69 /DNA_END=1616 /DNA_ORIENTATION=-
MSTSAKKRSLPSTCRSDGISASCSNSKAPPKRAPPKKALKTTPQTPPPEVPDLEDCHVMNGQYKSREPKFTLEEAPLLHSALLSWYDREHRVLPWRRNSHSKVAACSEHLKTWAPLELPEQDFAYRVWVSEVMCQQTQVATVVGFYDRWMQRWPTVADLASAEQEEVNEVWAGLGYYRRAKFLLLGAKHVMSSLGGIFPSDVPALLKVPGVGAYTAGAVASIAFNRLAPLVDGNVVRVLSRLRTLEGDPSTSQAAKTHWALAEQLVHPCRPGDFNQALMELGARVCTPRNPDCRVCPAKDDCWALRRVTQHPVGVNTPPPTVTDYPGAKLKAPPREERVAVCVVEVQGPESGPAVLLVRRPDKGLLAGLWEYPSVIVENTSEREAEEVAMNAYLASLGLEINHGSTKRGSKTALKVLERKVVGETVHVFSHIRQTMKVEKLVLSGDVASTCVEVNVKGAEEEQPPKRSPKKASKASRPLKIDSHDIENDLDHSMNGSASVGLTNDHSLSPGVDIKW